MRLYYPFYVKHRASVSPLHPTSQPHLPVSPHSTTPPSSHNVSFTPPYPQTQFPFHSLQISNFKLPKNNGNPSPQIRIPRHPPRPTRKTSQESRNPTVLTPPPPPIFPTNFSPKENISKACNQISRMDSGRWEVCPSPHSPLLPLIPSPCF